MGYTELNGTYQRLRTELDAAYARPVWNSGKIDQIAEQIVQVELALASAQHAGTAADRSFSEQPSAAARGDAS